MLSQAVFALAALLATANAHIVISSPVPYGQSTLTNSPLEDDGSDFPCKQRSGVYDITTMNNIAVGVPQNLSFMGGATHGGGSCQLSVSMDKEPTKDSEWRVIHTILGGCPNSVAGNAADSATYAQNPSFEYTMPKGMPNGQYTLAWTWFNKIGNREMYMNCAPITVTGGADDNDVFNTLPFMYVNNIPHASCSTTEGEDFSFPEPGLYVETYKSSALGSSTTGPSCAAMTVKGAGTASAQATGSAAGGSGAGSSAAAAGTTGAASAASASSPVASQDAGSAAAPQGNSGGGYVATLTTMSTVTALSSSAAGAAETAPAATGSAASASQTAAAVSNNESSPAGSSSGSCSGGSVSCSGDGTIVCIGSTQWGTCDAGCAVPMALAAGTTCSGGTISKRHDFHLRRHLMRAMTF